jgi:hypothetical protein
MKLHANGRIFQTSAEQTAALEPWADPLQTTRRPQPQATQLTTDERS